jgi:hypothetical protein
VNAGLVCPICAAIHLGCKRENEAAWSKAPRDGQQRIPGPSARPPTDRFLVGSNAGRDAAAVEPTRRIDG